MAKEKEATTIAITDSEINPLSITTNFTLVAPLTFVNIITNSYAALDKDLSLKKIKSIKKSLDEYPIFYNGPQ